ncbi:MAG: hypothetical protein LBR38_02030 [Synergistaceae bacterium]|jgi:type IV secretion system protein VirB10|nr:hypothetical protein [Synergistaceae bacterium]
MGASTPQSESESGRKDVQVAASRFRNTPISNRLFWILTALGGAAIAFVIFNLSRETEMMSTGSTSIPVSVVASASGAYSDRFDRFLAALSAGEPTAAPTTEKLNAPEQQPEQQPTESTDTTSHQAQPRVRRASSEAYTRSRQLRMSALASDPNVKLGLDNPPQSGGQLSSSASSALSGAAEGAERSDGDVAAWPGTYTLGGGAGVTGINMRPQYGYGESDPNASAMSHQDRNNAFIKNSTGLTNVGANDAKDEYIGSSRRAPRGNYELKAGSIISGVMIGGINSDLPGTIVGQVTENVYDTATGSSLLIPQGSRMIGSYDSHVVYGQWRILVVWQRIIYPDGTSLNLEGMSGSDQGGYAGFKQKVDNHYGRMLGAALFASVFAAAGKIATQNDTNRNDYNLTAGDAMSDATMQQVTQLGARLAERNMNVAPTLRILPGYRFSIITTKDVAFAGPYTPYKKR